MQNAGERHYPNRNPVPPASETTNRGERSTYGSAPLLTAALVTRAVPASDLALSPSVIGAIFHVHVIDGTTGQRRQAVRFWPLISPTGTWWWPGLEAFADDDWAPESTAELPRRPQPTGYLPRQRSPRRPSGAELLARTPPVPHQLTWYIRRLLPGERANAGALTRAAAVGMTVPPGANRSRHRVGRAAHDLVGWMLVGPGRVQPGIMRHVEGGARPQKAVGIDGRARAVYLSEWQVGRIDGIRRIHHRT